MTPYASLLQQANSYKGNNCITIDNGKVIEIHSIGKNVLTI